MYKIIMTSAMLIFAGFAIAESQYETFRNEIELMKQNVLLQRNDLIQQNMGLTVHEEKKFWGIYNGYWDDMKPILDLQVKLLTDYADAYVKNSLTDEQAIEFSETLLALKSAKLALRKKYIPRFQEILEPKKVARFLQLENKLDAIMNYDLARKIPLVPTKQK